MRNWFLIVSCVALLACSNADEEAQEVVRQTLKDPDSAKFGEFSQATMGGTEFGCLTVNAKNSFGGYVGDKEAALIKSADGRWELQEMLEGDKNFCMIRYANSLNPEVQAKQSAETERIIQESKEAIARIEACERNKSKIC